MRLNLLLVNGSDLMLVRIGLIWVIMCCFCVICMVWLSIVWEMLVVM